MTDLSQYRLFIEQFLHRIISICDKSWLITKTNTGNRVLVAYADSIYAAYLSFLRNDIDGPGLLVNCVDSRVFERMPKISENFDFYRDLHNMVPSLDLIVVAMIRGNDSKSVLYTWELLHLVDDQNRNKKSKCQNISLNDDSKTWGIITDIETVGAARASMSDMYQQLSDDRMEENTSFERETQPDTKKRNFQEAMSQTQKALEPAVCEIENQKKNSQYKRARKQNFVA